MVKMVKFCPKCNEKRKSKSNFCDICGTPLKEREDRIKFDKGFIEKVFRRDGYRCQMCGARKSDGVQLTIDHIIPLAAGGSNDIDNLQTLCKSCNENKADLIFKSGIDVEIEIKENDLKNLNKNIKEKQAQLISLNNSLSQEEEKLSKCNEDEKIDILFHIKQLKEEFIPSTESNLKKLTREYQKVQEELKLKKLEKQKKNRLYKTLYVNIDDYTLNILKKHFAHNRNSKTDILKSLVYEHDEKEISNVIFDEYYNDLNKQYQYLVIHRFGNSKKNFADYLLNNNFSKDNLINELQITRTELIDDLKNRELSNKQKILLKKYFSLDDRTDDGLANHIINSCYSKKYLLSILDSYKHELMEEIYSKLSDEDLNLIKEYYSINDYSKKQTVKYLFNKKDMLNYEDVSSLVNHIYEYNEVLSRASLEKERQITLKKLANTLTVRDTSLLMYRFSHCRSEVHLYSFLVNKGYSISDVQDLIKVIKKELYYNLQSDLSSQQINELSRMLNIPNSQGTVINHLIENYTVDGIYRLIKLIG